MSTKPKFFRVVFPLTTHPKNCKNLSTGVLKGIKGISANGRIMFDFLSQTPSGPNRVFQIAKNTSGSFKDAVFSAALLYYFVPDTAVFTVQRGQRSRILPTHQTNFFQMYTAVNSYSKTAKLDALVIAKRLPKPAVSSGAYDQFIHDTFINYGVYASNYVYVHDVETLLLEFNKVYRHVYAGATAILKRKILSQVSCDVRPKLQSKLDAFFEGQVIKYFTTKARADTGKYIQIYKGEREPVTLFDCYAVDAIEEIISNVGGDIASEIADPENPNVVDSEKLFNFLSDPDDADDNANTRAIAIQSSPLGDAVLDYLNNKVTDRELTYVEWLLDEMNYGKRVRVYQALDALNVENEDLHKLIVKQLLYWDNNDPEVVFEGINEGDVDLRDLIDEAVTIRVAKDKASLYNYMLNYILSNDSLYDLIAVCSNEDAEVVEQFRRIISDFVEEVNNGDKQAEQLLKENYSDYLYELLGAISSDGIRSDGIDADKESAIPHKLYGELVDLNTTYPSFNKDLELFHQTVTEESETPESETQLTTLVVDSAKQPNILPEDKLMLSVALSNTTQPSALFKDTDYTKAFNEHVSKALPKPLVEKLGNKIKGELQKLEDEAPKHGFSLCDSMCSYPYIDVMVNSADGYGEDMPVNTYVSSVHDSLSSAYHRLEELVNSSDFNLDVHDLHNSVLLNNMINHPTVPAAKVSGSVILEDLFDKTFVNKRIGSQTSLYGVKLKRQTPFNFIIKTDYISSDTKISVTDVMSAVLPALKSVYMPKPDRTNPQAVKYVRSLQHLLIKGEKFYILPRFDSIIDSKKYAKVGKPLIELIVEQLIAHSKIPNLVKAGILEKRDRYKELSETERWAADTVKRITNSGTVYTLRNIKKLLNVLKSGYATLLKRRTKAPSDIYDLQYNITCNPIDIMNMSGFIAASTSCQRLVDPPYIGELYSRGDTAAVGRALPTHTAGPTVESAMHPSYEFCIFGECFGTQLARVSGVIVLHNEATNEPFYSIYFGENGGIYGDLGDYVTYETVENCDFAIPVNMDEADVPDTMDLDKWQSLVNNAVQATRDGIHGIIQALKHKGLVLDKLPRSHTYLYA